MRSIPDLPEGMSWQFCAGGNDITSDFYAADDATEVRVWVETGDLVISAEDRNGHWTDPESDQQFEDLDAIAAYATSTVEG